MYMKKRAIIIVIDSMGIGALPDHAEFGDVEIERQLQLPVVDQSSYSGTAANMRIWFKFLYIL